ncbi:MAG: glycosyltransferase family 1 protein [Desulfobacterales bacterium]
MKIIVNAVPLSNIATGIGRYLKGLYAEIQRQRPDFVVRYFDGHRLREKMPTSPHSKTLWAFAVKTAWKIPAPLTYCARVVVSRKHARLFLKLAKGFDLYHEAGYFPFKTVPHVKTVFTLHDLSLKVLPDFHPKDRVLFFKKYFQKAISHTDAIITPSKFTRKELKRNYPDMDFPVFPIHLGFDKRLFFKQSARAINALKKKMDLPSDYVLFVGTSDPRKNIRTIMRAIALLPASLKLVVTGWRGWGTFMGKEYDSDDLTDRIIYTDYVADQDLAALYSGARVFLYPTYYEGFGLPVLEAMACGCPVVCSNLASLPEVTGDAAITCSPDDPNCLAASIYKVFTSDRLYSDMQHKGLQRARTFSWEKTAQKTLEVFTKM